MVDRGFFVTWHAIRRHLAAMPHELYLVRLIHGRTRRPFPGERLWTATHLTQESTIRFLRARNRAGCDVYIQPYAGDRNAGYILIDLDHTAPSVLDAMRANGHEPCVVLQTSPGHLQVWIHVSVAPLEPALATQVGKQLARTYGGDMASSDWRHLGRLAGFTNQKPQRRQWNGYAPWVRVLDSRLGLATHSTALLEQAQGHEGQRTGASAGCGPASLRLGTNDPTPAGASQIYWAWLNRLRIPQRFPHTDWSIADKWIAKELLRRHTPAGLVSTILQAGSPGFPRRHGNPPDYLRRTIARALQELAAANFPVPRTRCVDPLRWPQQARQP